MGGVSYDKVEDGGTSAVTFMPPGVFQMETKMPFGITQIKLISDKNATCKIKGKNYKLHLGPSWERSDFEDIQLFLFRFRRGSSFREL